MNIFNEDFMNGVATIVKTAVHDTVTSEIIKNRDNEWPPLMKKKEVAKFLGMTETTFNKTFDWRDDFPKVPIGTNTCRYPRDQILEFLKNTNFN
jgi:predicted DNA-binding transcriptional regulator AlpA